PILSPLVVFNLSFIIEAFVHQQAGLILRFFVLLWLFVLNLKILAKRTTPGSLGLGLRISCWIILVSYGGMIFRPDFYIQLLHGVLIGGFTLITLSVAVRVVLAHGGFSLEEEIRSRVI